MSDVSQLSTREFLALVFPLGFPAGSRVEVRIDTGHGVDRFWGSDPSDIITGAKPYYSTAKSIWYGPGLRNGPHGYDQDVQWVTTLWVDCDAKCFQSQTKAEALERLSSFKPQPNIIVDSGHGMQGYWLLDDYLCADSLALARAAIQSFQERLSEGLPRKLDSVQNLSRVLRVPNTVNRKEEPEIVSRVIFADSDSRLSVRSLSGYQAKVDAQYVSYEKDAMGEFVRDSQDPTSVGELADLVQKAISAGMPGWVRDALYRPEFFHKGDTSRLDWAVCCQLTQYLTLLESEAAWMQSALGNRPEDSKVRSRPDYRHRTLLKAREAGNNGK